MAEISLNLNGITEIPNGKVAYVVTYLEMRERFRLNLKQHDDVILERWAPGRDDFQKLFCQIGQDWLWSSRLVVEPDSLDQILRDPKREIYRPMKAGSALGLLELAFCDPENPEVAFFGLVPSAVGSGIGKWLMAQAVDLAWSRPETRRLWLHTCTADSPQAIHFYQACGFRAYRRAIEVLDDPRCSGVLPLTAGSHIPVIAS